MNPRKSSWFCTGSALIILTAACGSNAVHAQGGPPQMTPAALAGKKAPEVFKNIQVLKDLDADQLQSSMQFIAASLGVECSHCHVQHANDKDDKPAKVKARAMMRMTFELNKTSFEGKRIVTCNTCHQGAVHPHGTPAVLEKDGERDEPPHGSATSPAADQLFAKYALAAGGTAALEKITTRLEKGNVLIGEMRMPIEIYAKSPNKRVSISEGEHGQSMTAFDGASGWLGGGGMVRDMYPADARSAMVDAIFDLPLEAPKIFTELRPETPERVGDREMYVVSGRGPGVPLTKFYFDEQNGLLMRLERYNDVGLGLMPVRVDFADYREADGIKIPFHWTLSRPTGRFSIQIESVQQNLPIEDTKFARPSAPAAP